MHKGEPLGNSIREREAGLDAQPTEQLTQPLPRVRAVASSHKPQVLSNHKSVLRRHVLGRVSRLRQRQLGVAHRLAVDAYTTLYLQRQRVSVEDFTKPPCFAVAAKAPKSKESSEGSW